MDTETGRFFDKSVIQLDNLSKIQQVLYAPQYFLLPENNNAQKSESITAQFSENRNAQFSANKNA